VRHRLKRLESVLGEPESPTVDPETARVLDELAARKATGDAEERAEAQAEIRRFLRESYRRSGGGGTT
jgi:hypothetical protein